MIEREIATVKKNIDYIKQEEEKKTDEIIKRAIKNADEMLNNQLRAVKEENDVLINGTRARLTEELKHIETMANVNIDEIAGEIFNSLFSNKTHDTRIEKERDGSI